MKTKISIITLALFAFIFQGCEKDDNLLHIEESSSTSSIISNNKSNMQASKVKDDNKKSTYTEASYQIIMDDLKTDVDNILLTSKPSSLTLDEYKIELIDGNYTLSATDEQDLLDASQDLIDYGIYYATQHSISIDLTNPEETIAMGGLFSPNDTLEIDSLGSDTGYYYNNVNLTWGDVGKCAAVAIGADLIWSIGDAAASGGHKWTRKLVVKAFGKIASRFLGPFGVAIAVASFGLCLAGVS